MNSQAWIAQAVMLAEQGKHKLSDEIMTIPGMTGAKVAWFLNALCRHPACNYLEVGCFKGATLLSAAYRNLGRFTGIDNFSFDGKYDDASLGNAFYANLERLGSDNIKFHKHDCWTVPLDQLPQDVNIYFYDGDHSEESQRRALTHFRPVMADTFIYVVDDWGSLAVQTGTLRGIVDGKYEATMAVFTKGDFTKEPNQATDDKHDGWWNGLGIFQLEKK